MCAIGARADYLRHDLRKRLIEHQQHIRRFGEDMAEIRDWKWPYGGTGAAR